MWAWVGPGRCMYSMQLFFTVLSTPFKEKRWWAFIDAVVILLRRYKHDQSFQKSVYLLANASLCLSVGWHGGRISGNFRKPENLAAFSESSPVDQTGVFCYDVISSLQYHTNTLLVVCFLFHIWPVTRIVNHALEKVTIDPILAHRTQRCWRYKKTLIENVCCLVL